MEAPRTETVLVGAAIGVLSAVAASLVNYIITQRGTKDYELNYWNRALAAMLDASLQMLQLPVEMRARVNVHKRVTEDDALWFATAASSAIVDLGRAHSVTVLCAEDRSLLAAATAVFNAAEAVQAIGASGFCTSPTDSERELRAARQVLLEKIDELPNN